MRETGIETVTEIVKVQIDNEPYFLEVEAETFTLNGHKFAYHPKDTGTTHEFTHVHSGLGFSGNRDAFMMDSFESRVLEVGYLAFWKLMNESQDLYDSISEKAILARNNEIKKGAFKRFQSMMDVPVFLCRASLVAGIVRLDIIKLDDNLKRKHREYSDRMTTRDAIEEFYSKKVLEYFDTLTNEK